MPCPYGLDIPGLMKFRNDYLAKDLGLSAKEVLAAYAKALPEPLRRAEHCTGCGICAPHCPQQIDIPKEIAAIDRVIDSLKDEVVQ
jgi:predicted aldo/keto reductase-like oxidoreductase